VVSLTGWLDPDITLEAVATDTPASWATCRSEFGVDPPWDVPVGFDATKPAFFATRTGC
jgi:hypothetical protein